METQSGAPRAPGIQSLVRSERPSDEARVPRPAFAWKTRVALPLFLLAAIVGLLGFTGRDALTPARDVQVVPVVVREGVEQSARPSASTTSRSSPVVQAAGWLEPDPYPIAVTALTEGVVREVLVLEGQAVRANEVVARLVDDDAKLALARADAELAAGQAELRAAEADWDHPIDLDRDVAVAISDVAEARAELKQLDADVAVEDARLAELDDQFKRLSESFDANAASPVEYAQTKLKLQTQTATVEAMQARRAVLEAKHTHHAAELQAAKDHRSLRIEQHKRLDAAKAAVALAAAARDEAKLRLSRTEVRASADGIAIDRLVTPGSKLMLNSDMADSATVVKLYDPKHLQVRADVPLADANKVSVGMTAQVVVDVLPDQSFDAVVTRIVQAADISKNTLQVKVAIKNPLPALKPDMLARVRFFASTPRDISGATKSSSGLSVFAPRSLIESDRDETFAWIVDRASDTARRVSVEIGTQEHEGWVSVASGLHAGDQLIADASGLKDGTHIRIVGEAASVKGGDHGIH